MITWAPRSSAIWTAAKPVIVPPPLIIIVWPAAILQVEAVHGRFDSHRQGGRLDKAQAPGDRPPLTENGIVGRPGRGVADIVGDAEHLIADADIADGVSQRVDGSGYV